MTIFRHEVKCFPHCAINLLQYHLYLFDTTHLSLSLYLIYSIPSIACLYQQFLFIYVYTHIHTYISFLSSLCCFCLYVLEVFVTRSNSLYVQTYLAINLIKMWRYMHNFLIYITAVTRLDTLGAAVWIWNADVLTYMLLSLRRAYSYGNLELSCGLQVTRVVFLYMCIYWR